MDNDGGKSVFFYLTMVNLFFLLDLDVFSSQGEVYINNLTPNSNFVKLVPVGLGISGFSPFVPFGATLRIFVSSNNAIHAYRQFISSSNRVSHPFANHFGASKSF